MSKNFVRATVLGVVFTFSLSALATERRIKQSETPKAVIEAVKKKYPSSRMLELALPAKVSQAISASKYARWKIELAETVVLDENESQATYEIALVQGKNRVELMFDPAGKLLKENKKAAAD